MSVDARAEHLATRRMARSGWIWVAMVPMGAALAVVMAALTYRLLGLAWDAQASLLQTVLIAGVTAVPLLGPPLMATRSGMRAARRGSASGTVAAGTGALLLAVLLLWWVLGIRAA
jgi:hypothetical protein